MELSSVSKSVDKSRDNNELIEKKKDVRDISTNKVKRCGVRRKNDKELDMEATKEESISIFVVLLVVILCCAVGIGLGIYLYKLAINSSNAIIVSRFLLG